MAKGMTARKDRPRYLTVAQSAAYDDPRRWRAAGADGDEAPAAQQILGDDLARLAPTEVLQVISPLTVRELALALRLLDNPAREAIFRNLSPRLAAKVLAAYARPQGAGWQDMVAAYCRLTEGIRVLRDGAAAAGAGRPARSVS